MGLKRIAAIIEVTYPEDDGRTLDQLRLFTQEAVAEGVQGYTGTLAAYAVTAAFIDPDAEPSLPETGQ